MSDSLTTEPETAFVCDCEEYMRSACFGESFYKEHEGKRYCVLHFPGKEKSADFEKALQRKLENKDFDFRGVWFPSEALFSKFDLSAAADFSGATFSAAADFSGTFSAVADFSRATFSAWADFSGATFSAEAYFSEATFSAAADFSEATFSAAAYFREATFSAAAYFGGTFSAAAYFSWATFSATADFRGATFSAAADFSEATFSAAADFNGATFAARVRLAGDGMHNVFSNTSSLDLQFARIEEPDHVSFHTITLRPHWFVNVDARKFHFTNVDWDWRTINEEIKSLENNRVESPHRLLAIACRHLAVNAEENHRYEEASTFRYWAMDVRPPERWRGLAFWRLSWWYRLASGYGERVRQALLVLLGI